MTTPGESAEPRRGGSDTTVTFGRIELPIDDGLQPGSLTAEEQTAISAVFTHSEQNALGGSYYTYRSLEHREHGEAENVLQRDQPTPTDGSERRIRACQEA